MTALLIAALALASPDYDLSWKGGMSCADGVCTLPPIVGNLQLTCSSCPSLIYQTSSTTDAAGNGITMHAGHAFGTSKDGGDLTLCGGDASHSIATTAAIAAGDSVDIYIDGVLVDTLVEGVAADFDCSGTDDTCAASLCAAIEAQSGVSCSGTTSPINPQVDADKCTVSFAFADGAADGVVGVDTTGSDGVIKIPDHLYFINDPDTGIRRYGANYFNFIAGGSPAIGATGAYLYVLKPVANPGGVMLFGGSVATSHGLSYQDAAFYADVEVDGILYADSNIIQSTAKGAATTQLLNVDSITFDANPGNASKTTSGLCPANSIVHGITYRVPTAATNCASVEIGDGTDVDMFGTAQAITQGTTGDISDYTDQATRVNVYTATGFEATVTANGGNCFDGVWRFTCHYTQLTADSAN
jgi:hypothetical protein